MALGCYDVLCSICVLVKVVVGKEGDILAVWQIPENFISIRSSSGRSFVSVMGMRLKPAFKDSTTRAEVSKGRVVMIAESYWV